MLVWLHATLDLETDQVLGKEMLNMKILEDKLIQIDGHLVEEAEDILQMVVDTLPMAVMEDDQQWMK